jgi:hypothetical protein
MLKPHLQSILLRLFWRWGSLVLFAMAGLKPVILLISASQVAKIIGVNSLSQSLSISIPSQWIHIARNNA